MVFDPNRPACVGDYVTITDLAKESIGTATNGPFKVCSIFHADEDPRCLFDIGFGRAWAVFEDHCLLVEPPRMTLAQKELAARQGWQLRRDENLKQIFAPRRNHYD